MFEGLKNTLVYRSKDERDWNKARELLDHDKVLYRAWKSEEPPVGGCGSKLDVRSLASVKIPRTIFSIEVRNNQAKAARETLSGKVLPPRSYGAGI